MSGLKLVKPSVGEQVRRAVEEGLAEWIKFTTHADYPEGVRPYRVTRHPDAHTTNVTGRVGYHLADYRGPILRGEVDPVGMLSIHVYPHDASCPILPHADPHEVLDRLATYWMGSGTTSPLDEVLDALKPLGEIKLGAFRATCTVVSDRRDKEWNLILVVQGYRVVFDIYASNITHTDFNDIIEGCTDLTLINKPTA